MALALGAAFPKRASSSSGRGSGAVQSVSPKDVGRPVIVDRIRSIEHKAHQTRYLISFEASVTFLVSLIKFKPRVEA